MIEEKYIQGTIEDAARILCELGSSLEPTLYVTHEAEIYLRCIALLSNRIELLENRIGVNDR